MVFSFAAIKLFLGGAIPNLLEFVMKYWKQMIVISMVAFIYYQNNFETRRLFGVDTIPYYQQELQNAKDDAEHHKQQTEQLIQRFKDVSAEVMEWKKKSETLEQEYKELAGKLIDMRQANQAEVTTILQDATPESCEAAIEYLRQGREDLQW